MTDEAKPVGLPEPGEAPAADTILELNFVPEWARRAPGAVEFREREGRRPPRDDRREDRRDERGTGRHRRDRRDGVRGGRGPGAGRRPDGAGRPDARPGPPRAPFGGYAPPPPRMAAVDVRILPDQKHLAALVRRVHASKRVYPLLQLAGVFVSNPEFSSIRIEPRAGTRLFQCKACQAVSTDRAVLEAHLLNRHMDEHFEREDTTVDPPSGQFVCVARCGLSGALLGPPNHHSYAARVQDVHRERYPGMSIDTYRGRIEMVHDPAVIEQWKESCRHQVVYRPKTFEGEQRPSFSKAEAARHFAEKIAPGLLLGDLKRVAVPARTALGSEDRALAAAVEDIWRREERFPLALSFALRAAFRHMHLHVFKVGRVTLATPVPPSPLDPEHVVSPIKEVLVYLTAHPGTTREGLLRALCPNAAPDSPESKAVLSPLGWLIERGHIIEFFDGSMAVPLKTMTPSAAPPPKNAAPPPAAGRDHER